MKYLFSTTETLTRIVTITVRADTLEQARWLAELCLEIEDQKGRELMATSVPAITNMRHANWAKGDEPLTLSHYATEGP